MRGQLRILSAFLHLDHYVDKDSKRVFDLVRRPNRTLDILPWFESEGDCFVVVRSSYPRPLLQARCRRERTLDGARAAGYITEPLVAVQEDRPRGSTVVECLRSDAGISESEILGFQKGVSYYPSPGGIEEVVASSLVEITPTFDARPLENATGFSTAGRVMAVESQQVLRSAQVGGLLDARIEMKRVRATSSPRD